MSGAVDGDTGDCDTGDGDTGDGDTGDGDTGDGDTGDGDTGAGAREVAFMCRKLGFDAREVHPRASGCSKSLR